MVRRLVGCLMVVDLDDANLLAQRPSSPWPPPRAPQIQPAITEEDEFDEEEDGAFGLPFLSCVRVNARHQSTPRRRVWTSPHPIPHPTATDQSFHSLNAATLQRTRTCATCSRRTSSTWTRRVRRQ